MAFKLRLASGLPLLLATGVNLGADPAAPTNEQKMEAMKTEIKALAEADLECNVNTDCQFAGLGDRTCGGPREYIVYSTKKGPQDELKRKIAELNELDRRNNREKAIFSDCSHIFEPIVKCRQSKCKKVAPYRPGRYKKK